MKRRTRVQGELWPVAPLAPEAAMSQPAPEAALSEAAREAARELGRCLGLSPAPAGWSTPRPAQVMAHVRVLQAALGE